MLPPNLSQGAGLGLTRSDQPRNTTANQFVAVEFDIFKNNFYPPGEQVGIDINTMQSVNYITWLCDISGGRRNNASISYNSSTHNLSVAFTGYRNNTVEMQFLSQIVRLRDYVPETVIFGFSASTGALSALHTVYSWDFSSTQRPVVKIECPWCSGFGGSMVKESYLKQLSTQDYAEILTRRRWNA
jgi:hypothetical protein